VVNNQFAISISKEQLASLPMAEYSGDIVLVDSLENVDAAIRELREADVIGFDTETRPSFKKGQTNVVSLMQLSTRSRCFLFRLNRIGLIPELKALLEDPDILKIGLSIHDDFHNLRKLADINPMGFIDLQNYVKDFRIVDNSLARIYAILFGQRISKGQRLTNWEASSLTSHQQSYAALDARACIRIYDCLSAGEFVVEESQYFHEIIPPDQQYETSDEK